jgi:hypothetical protein
MTVALWVELWTAQPEMAAPPNLSGLLFGSGEPTILVVAISGRGLGRDKVKCHA